jgi:hypothetical protein
MTNSYFDFFQAGACIMRIPRSIMFSAASAGGSCVGGGDAGPERQRYYASLDRLVEEVRSNETLALALTLLFHALRPGIEIF